MKFLFSIALIFTVVIFSAGSFASTTVTDKTSKECSIDKVTLEPVKAEMDKIIFTLKCSKCDVNSISKADTGKEVIKSTTKKFDNHKDYGIGVSYNFDFTGRYFYISYLSYPDHSTLLYSQADLDPYNCNLASNRYTLRKV